MSELFWVINQRRISVSPPTRLANEPRAGSLTATRRHRTCGCVRMSVNLQ